MKLIHDYEHTGMRKKYRSRIEIISAILRTAEKGTTKTSIMYGAYVSHVQMAGYLDMLMEKRLLHYYEANNIYDLTGRGLRLIHLLEDLEKPVELPAGNEEMDLKSNCRGSLGIRCG